MTTPTVTTPTESPRPVVPVLVPAVDIYENHDDVLLLADLPGAGAESVRLEIEGGVLALSAERSTGALPAVAWKRSFVVPPALRTEHIAAELKDGVLRIKLPRAPKQERRTIEVKSA